MLEELLRAARDNPAYEKLLQCVREDFPRDRYASLNTLRPFWKLLEDLYCEDDLVLYGARVVVPVTLHRRVLVCLHDSHHGALLRSAGCDRRCIGPA